jgi:hypothetical protein
MARYLRSVAAEMIENNQTEIRSCRRFKRKRFIDPKFGEVQEHLVTCGFMDGNTRWQSVEDDDDVHGATRNEEGHHENNGEDGREDEEFPRHDDEGDSEHNHHVEDVGHDDEYQEGRHDDEYEYAKEDGTSLG